MARSNIGFKRIILAAEWTVGGKGGNGETGQEATSVAYGRLVMSGCVHSRRGQKSFDP